MASRVTISDAQYPEGNASITPINSEIFYVDITWSNAPGTAFTSNSINLPSAAASVTLTSISPKVFRARINTGGPVLNSSYSISIPSNIFDDNDQQIRSFNIDSFTPKPIWRDQDWITSNITTRNIEISTFFDSEVSGVMPSDFQLRGIIDGRTYAGTDYIVGVNRNSLSSTDFSDTSIQVSVQLPDNSFGIVNFELLANSVLNTRLNKGPADIISSSKQLIFDTRPTQEIIDTANLETDWKVLLLGIDISEHVAQVRNIIHRLDLQTPTEFKISNSTIHLINESGLFSPENPQNFFVQNGGVQNGYKTEVTIVSGFEDGLNNNVLMIGEIIEIEYEESSGTVAFIISEKSQDLRNEQLNDFGLTKYAAVQESGSRFHGIYPFLDPVTPISDTSVKASFGDIEFTESQTLKKEGITNASKFIVKDSLIETEQPLGTGTILQTEFKAPYRNKSIGYLIREILAYYDINNYNIDIPENTGDVSFTTRGRIGYDVETSSVEDKNAIWNWGGYVTDYVYQENDNESFGLGIGLGGLVYHNGYFWAISSSNNRLFRIDPVTGLGTWWGPAGLGLNIPEDGNNRNSGIEVWNNYFWAATRDGGSTVKLYRVDPETGVGLRMKDLDTPTQDWSQRVSGHPTDLMVKDDKLWVGARQGIAELEFNNDFTAVKLSSTPEITWTRGTFGGMQSITYYNNTIYSCTLSSQLVTVDPQTGATTAIGSLPSAFSGLTVANNELYGGSLNLNQINDETGQATRVTSKPIFWFLYSSPDTATFPQILEYNVEADSFRIAYKHNTHTEFWGLTTGNFNTFYILATENTTSNPVFAPEGTYDSGETTTVLPKILSWNKTLNTRATYIDPDNVSLNPQLAQFYHFGFTQGQPYDRIGSKPDTRKRNLESTSGYLYYIWANTSEFGLAATYRTDNPDVVVTIPKDNRGNHMGFDWVIDGRTIYCAHTRQSTTGSHLLIYSRPIL